MRGRVVRDVNGNRSALKLVPANNNGSVAFRMPTLTRPKLYLIVAPLVTLVGSRMHGLHSQNVGTLTICSNVAHRRVVITLRGYVFNSCGFLCVSPRELSARVFHDGLQGVGMDVVAMSRSRYVSR